MDHHRLRFPDPVPPKRRSLREFARDRVRLALLIGLILLLVGSVLPWMHSWLPYRGFFEVSGFERAGDAGLLLEFAAVALVLTWSDRAWNSRVAVLVAGPLALGTIAMLLLRVANGDANIYFGSLALQGGRGELLPAFWAANIGAAVATVAAGVHLWRARTRLSFDIGLTLPAVAGAIGGVAGAIGGFIAGKTIAELLTVGSLAAVSSSLIVVIAFVLALLGGWLGATGASRVAASRGRSAR